MRGPGFTPPSIVADVAVSPYICSIYISPNSKLSLLHILYTHIYIYIHIFWVSHSPFRAKFVNIYMEEPGNTITQHGVSSDQVNIL